MENLTIYRKIIPEKSYSRIGAMARYWSLASALVG